MVSCRGSCAWYRMGVCRIGALHNHCRYPVRHTVLQDRAPVSFSVWKSHCIRQFYGDWIYRQSSLAAYFRVVAGARSRAYRIAFLYNDHRDPFRYTVL